MVEQGRFDLRTVGDVAAELVSDAETGVSPDEAAARLVRRGPDVLAAEWPLLIRSKAIAQFSDILMILFIVAAAMSAGSWIFEHDTALPYEALAIASIVLLDACTAITPALQPAPAVVNNRWLVAPVASLLVPHAAAICAPSLRKAF